MAIGRFRKDPQEMDEVEQEVYAAQHAEGALVFMTLLGLTVIYSAQTYEVIPSMLGFLYHPLALVLITLLTGFLGYVLGYIYRLRLIQRKRNKAVG